MGTQGIGTYAEHRERVGLVQGSVLRITKRLSGDRPTFIPPLQPLNLVGPLTARQADYKTLVLSTIVTTIMENKLKSYPGHNLSVSYPKP